MQAARKRLIAGTVVAAIAATWLCYTLYSTKPFQDCLGAKQDEYKASHRTEHYPPKGALALLVNTRDDTVCAFRVLYDYRDAATTIATIFIALFTLTLWRSTNRLWKEARDSRRLTVLSVNAAATSANAASRMAKATERQLRAYVLINNAQSDISADRILRAALEVKNFGQTPAYDVLQWVSIVGVSKGDVPNLPKSGEGIKKASALLGPGGRVEMSVPCHDVITPGKEAALKSGEAAIYVCGEIAYKDVFGDSHSTKYKLVLSGEGAAEGRFKSAEDGNEAT